MRRVILVVAALCMGAAGAMLRSQGPPAGGGRGGAPAPAPTGTGLIVGTVVDAATGKPVGGAVVTVGGRAANPPVIVGSDGRFAFRDLPAGSFPLMVSKNGYLMSWAGRTTPTGPTRPVELRDGDRVGDVVLRLWRQAVVSGNIVDERGEPAVGLHVALLQRALNNGEWSLQERQTTRSDDRGAYRFAKIEPGQYVVAARQDPDSFLQPAVAAMAADLPAMMSVFAGVIASAGAQMPEIDFRARVIPAALAPGVGTAEEAMTLTIAPGDERSGITIRVARAATYRVAGTVTGSETTPPNLTVELTSPALFNQPVGMNLAGIGPVGRGGGRFDIAGVPPGRYVLRAIAVPRPGGPPGPGRGRAGSAMPPAPAAPTWWATQPITVTDRDETEVTLVLRQGVRITGRLQFDGAAAAPPSERFSVSAGAFDSATGWRTGMPTGVAVDGSFRTLGLPPGRYVLRVTGNVTPWRLKSVHAGGRDMTDAPIDIGSEDVAEVVITVTDRPASSLAGTVRNTRGEVDTSAVVYLFPADRQRWTNLSSTALRFKTQPVTSSGRYSLSDLPEGEYFALAAAEDRVDDWLQVRVLEEFAARATRIQIGEGEARLLDLTRRDR